jgi:hypothetical protein
MTNSDVPPVHVLCSLQMVSTSPFPNATPCRLPPSLLAVCTWLLGALGPTTQSISVVFVFHRGTVTTRHHCGYSAFQYLMNALKMGHCGPLVPVSSLKVAVLSGPFSGRVRFLPPCSQDWSNEVIGGGNVHGSLTTRRRRLAVQFNFACLCSALGLRWSKGVP